MVFCLTGEHLRFIIPIAFALVLIVSGPLDTLSDFLIDYQDMSNAASINEDLDRRLSNTKWFDAKHEISRLPRYTQSHDPLQPKGVYPGNEKNDLSRQKGINSARLQKMYHLAGIFHTTWRIPLLLHPTAGPIPKVKMVPASPTGGFPATWLHQGLPRAFR